MENTINVILTVAVPAIGRDGQGTLGGLPCGNFDAYREAALELLEKDLVHYVEQAYVEGE